MVKKYIPDRGDIVLLDLSPQAGREQAGKRPALVLSHQKYNEKTGLMIACPITSRVKGYPFEVELAGSLKTRGVILADHVKSLDWHSRNTRFLEKISSNTTMEDLLNKLLAVIS